MNSLPKTMGEVFNKCYVPNLIISNLWEDQEGNKIYIYTQLVGKEPIITDTPRNSESKLTDELDSSDLL